MKIENYYKQEEIFSWTYWHTSTVIYECFNNKETVIKEYWWFDLEDIKIYQNIQNIIKELLDGAYNTNKEELYWFNEKIQLIQIEVLKLDNSLPWLCCYNTNLKWLEDKKITKWEPFPITQLPYVQWRSLWSIENNLWFKNTLKDKENHKNILTLIERVQEIFTEKTWITKQLYPHNIKVNYENWTLNLIITDVAGNIMSMVEHYKKLYKLKPPHTAQEAAS